MALNATKTINGTFCRVVQNNEWLTNAKGAELQVEINYEDVPRAGTRKMGKKATTIDSTGTLTNYKLTNRLLRQIAQITDDARGAFVTELYMRINDPESPESKVWIRVKGVQFTTIPVLNYEVGSIVEEELPFVFDDFDYV